MTAAHPNVSAEGRANAPFKLPRRRWRRLLAELQHRGEGRRESGAFLLAGRNSDRVTHVAYYDDLDADCLTGGISFASSGFTKLWRICERLDLRVVADVHTHPGAWVGQSGIDADNPMVARVGHVAIIVPSFGDARRVDECGVHIYLGSRRWLPIPPGQGGDVVRVYGLFSRDQADDWRAALNRLVARGDAA